MRSQGCMWRGDAGRPSHSSLDRIWPKPLSAVGKFPRRRLVSQWPPHSSSAGFLSVMCHIPRALFAVPVFSLWPVCSERERRWAGPARRTWCRPVATQPGSVVSTNACTHRCALHSLRGPCPLAVQRSQRETSTRPRVARARRPQADPDADVPCKRCKGQSRLVASADMSLQVPLHHEHPTLAPE